MLSTSDIVELEHAALGQVFKGQVASLLTRHNLPDSPLPTKKGEAITGLLISYTKHKVGAAVESGSTQRGHINQMGAIKEKLRDIADGDATALLRAADDNITRALAGKVPAR